MMINALGVAFFEAVSPDSTGKTVVELLHDEYLCDSLLADERETCKDALLEELNQKSLQPGFYKAAFVYEVRFYRVGWEYEEWDCECMQKLLEIKALCIDELKALNETLKGILADEVEALDTKLNESILTLT